MNVSSDHVGSNVITWKNFRQFGDVMSSNGQCKDGEIVREPPPASAAESGPPDPGAVSKFRAARPSSYNSADD